MRFTFARNWARRIAIFGGVVLLAGLLRAVLLQRPSASSRLTAAPLGAQQSSGSSARGPSLRVMLLAERAREAQILALLKHPEAVHAVAEPQTAPANNAPNSIPAGVFPPFPGYEASTITDFNGFTGISEIDGTGTETESGVVTPGDVFLTDIRFMKGQYIGVDGNAYAGAFVYLWLEVVDASTGNIIHEIHDMIPGSDVFSTGFASNNSVTVVALLNHSTLRLTNFSAQDYHTPENFFSIPGPGPYDPVTVNLTMNWNSRPRIQDLTNGFTGYFLGEPATMQWSATGATFTFVADTPSPLTQFDTFSTVSRLRNGVFQ
jgi:hypothetical protein